MLKPAVIWGMGELGGVFARGFLKANRPVYPITRTSDVAELAAQIDPEVVVMATGEGETLQSALAQVPAVWKDRLVLIQNELLPGDWAAHALVKPTVISIWFEKKKGMDSKVLIPSPAFGPKAELLQEALATLDIPVRWLDSKAALLHELVVKNLYIVTTNVAGLALPEGADVTDLQAESALFEAVARDVWAIQQALTGQTLDFETLMQGVKAAMDGDPAHKCKGRSAPARLARALKQAQTLGVELKKIHRL